MTRMVVDASVSLAWCMPDEVDGFAASVLRSLATNSAIVPAHWSLQVTNALIVAERKGRIGAADTIRAITLLHALPIAVDAQTADRAMGETLSLARAHRLTTYDAAYLELAVREGLPLATQDTDLKRAAKEIGVATFNV